MKRYCDDFFFQLTSARPMAVIRIGLAFLFAFWLLSVFDSAESWYGSDAIVSTDLARRLLPNRFCVSLLTYFQPTTTLIHSFLSLGLLASFTLLLGWHSRISAIFCFVIMESLMHRNPFVLSSADELMSQMFFYLILSNAGLALSLDRIRLKAQSKESHLEAGRVWAQRLLQIQICVVYLQTFWFKVVQPDWQSGDVIYLVLRTKEIANFSVPELISNSRELCRYMTWAALCMELAIPVLIWFKQTRKIVMLVAVLFHLSMEYCLSIPFFQPLMIVGLLSFAEDRDYQALCSRISKHIGQFSLFPKSE